MGTRRQLMLALQLTPDLVLDPLQTSPKLVELFEEVSVDMARPPEASPSPTAFRYVYVHDPRSGAPCGR
jgi:hypothetical protein